MADSDNLVPVESPASKAVTVGELADYHAALHALADYLKRLSANTRRRQQDDLALFACYLGLAGIEVTAQQLMNDIIAWQGITHELVSGFLRYQSRKAMPLVQSVYACPP